MVKCTRRQVRRLKTPEYAAEIAAEFVRLSVDVIVTSGAVVPTLKRATSVIPIVFAIEGDPVGSGIVASLAKPGGNVTGLSLQASDAEWNRPLHILGDDCMCDDLGIRE